jgi:hypothetical protein
MGSLFNNINPNEISTNLANRLIGTQFKKGTADLNKDGKVTRNELQQTGEQLNNKLDQVFAYEEYLTNLQQYMGRYGYNPQLDRWFQQRLTLLDRIAGQLESQLDGQSFLQTNFAKISNAAAAGNPTTDMGMSITYKDINALVGKDGNADNLSTRDLNGKAPAVVQADVTKVFTYLTRVSPDGSFDATDMKNAANTAKGTVYETLFNNLATVLKENGNRAVNYGQLLKLAKNKGNDLLISPQEAKDLPSILGWTNTTSPNSITKLRSVLDSVSTDTNYSEYELIAAAQKSTDPTQKEIFNKLTYFARTFKRDVTLDQIKKAAGTDNVMTLDEANKFAEVNGWTNNNQEPNSITKLQAVLDTVSTDTNYSEYELVAAAQKSTDPTQKEIFNKLTYFARTFKRDVTLDQIKKAAGTDNVMTLDEANKFAEVNGWNNTVVDNLPDGPGWIPDMTRITPYLKSFSADESYTEAELRSAANGTKSGVYKQAFNALADLAKDYNRPITGAELQKLAGTGTDTTFGLDEIKNLPTVNGWTQPVVDILPDGPGWAPDLDRIKPYMKSFSTDESYTAAELRNAANGTKSGVYKQAFNELAVLSEHYGRPITAAELQKLAGGDPVFNLDEIKNLPKANGWPIDTLPTGSTGYSPDLSRIKPFMTNFSTDESYTAAELRNAANGTQSPIYKQAFNELAVLSEHYGRPVTTAELQKLAGGDPVFNLDEIKNLPKANGWPIDTLPTGSTGYSPDLSRIKPFMTNFSTDESYTATELRNAANGTQSPIYKQAFNELAGLSEQYNRPITTAELQKLAGGDPIFNLGEIKNLPTVNGWPTIPSPVVGAKISDLTAVLNLFSPGSTSYNDIVLSMASGTLSNPVDKEVLDKLSYFSRHYSRNVTLDEIKKAAGADNIFTLDEANMFAQVNGW